MGASSFATRLDQLAREGDLTLWTSFAVSLSKYGFAARPTRLMDHAERNASSVETAGQSLTGMTTRDRRRSPDQRDGGAIGRKLERYNSPNLVAR